MPGVQNKYSIDVTNRFNVDNDDIDVDQVDDEEIVEDVDPFEELKILKLKAAEAKSVPKPKVIKKKATPTNTKVEIEREGTGNRRKQTGNNERKTGNNDKPRERRPKPPRTSDDKAGIEGERPKREYKGERRAPRKDGNGEKRTFDRKSRDPKSSNKAFDKKDGSGSGNWGTTNDELAGQTEKIDQETTDQTGNDKKNEERPAAPVEPEEPPTMTLEEYRNQSRNIKRNPNAKITEEKTTETVKANQADVKRKGRAGRVAPVDFRPAPLVQRGGDRKQRGDRRDGNKYEKRQQKNDAAGAQSYNLADDFPSL